MDLSRINEKQGCVAYGCICLEFLLTWFGGGTIEPPAFCTRWMTSSISMRLSWPL